MQLEIRPGTFCPVAEPHYTHEQDAGTQVVVLEVPASEPASASRWLRAGVALMAISLLFWVPLPVIPFLPLPVEARAALGGSMLLGAEIVFWLGAILAGPEAVKRGKSWVRDRLRLRSVRASR